MVEHSFPHAISALDKGEVIVYPTDTLYGLGADIYNEKAVTKVFKIKKRPFTDPLSVAVSSIEDIEDIAFINDISFVLARFFLPGKLTLILNKKEHISDVLTSGSNKIAVRIPDNKIALRLTSAFGPITCTSANIHGKKTPTVISDINMQFKEHINVYIDNGKLDNPPSTIVDTTEDKVIIAREGAISKKEIIGAVSNG